MRKRKNLKRELRTPANIEADVGGSKLVCLRSAVTFESVIVKNRVAVFWDDQWDGKDKDNIGAFTACREFVFRVVCTL